MNINIRSRIVVSTVILALALAVGFFGTEVISGAVRYPDAYAQANLLRLHVLANSDSPADQQLKLAVRDAILLESAKVFGEANTKQEALGLLMDNQEDIRAAALSVVRAWDKDYDVRLEIGNFEFPEKTYGELTLPSGSYDALRVVIGAGAGHNWWCILFPPLCLVDAREGADLVPVKGPSSAGRVPVRFRLKFAGPALEWGSKVIEMARKDWLLPRWVSDVVAAKVLAAQDWK